MNYLADAVWIEMRKAMRSRVPLFTALGCLMMPLASAFLIHISKDPELARKLGLISAKASFLFDGTLKDLLAVPVPRSSIVLAKFIAVAV